MKMSEMSESTPTSINDRKRELSSPEDNVESKRHQPALDDSTLHHVGSGTDSEPEEPFADTLTDTLTTPTILQPSDFEKMIACLKESVQTEVGKSLDIDVTLEKKLDACVTKIVDGVLGGLEKRITDLEAANAKLRVENDDLTERVAKLEASADASEQYSRRNCLRISGIPESPNGQKEDTDSHVMRICKYVDIPLTHNDIDRSHRVGRRMTDASSKPRQIIVKFATYRARQAFYTLRRSLGSEGSPFKGVFINEDLTKKRSSLLFEARKLKKSNKLMGAWTSDGTVLVKNMHGRVHRIQCKSDLSKIFT